MQELDDITLLRQYVDHGSEDAFATLVARHIDRVYSIALRHTGNPHQAEEITQAVFVILAKKSPHLGKNVILAGWLYQTARLTALTFIRGEIRRIRREQEAAMQNVSDKNESALWTQIAPLLDAAMARLNETDRHALILRFFYGMSMNDIGTTLGASEDSARMRIHRALEKLQHYFSKQGIHSTTAAMTGAVSNHAIQPAPALLAATTTALAMAKGATASASTLTLIQGALKVMAWTKTKITIVAGTCLLLAAGTTTIAVHVAGKILHPTLQIRSIPSDWSALSGNRDQWEWINGAINGHSTNGDSILASTRQYGDVTLEGRLSTTNREAALTVRFQDANNGYLAVFVPDGTPGAGGIGRVTLLRRADGQETELGIFKRRGLSGPGNAEKITFSAKGSRLEVRLNDVPVVKADDDLFPAGFVGLRVYGDAGIPCDGVFSNLTVH